MSVEYQKEIQSKVRLANRKTPEKESEWLIFHCKIDQEIKNAATKVVRANMKSIIEELYSENYIYI